MTSVNISNLVGCVEKYISTGCLKYDIEEGRIVFFPGNNDQILIHSFFLKENFQNRGILKTFLLYLSDHFDEIWFFQCNPTMSCILLTTALKNRYFVNRYTGEWIWTKNDTTNADTNIKIYDHSTCICINDILIPLKNELKNCKEAFNMHLLQYYNDYVKYL